ncbi:MAG: hypothetical protein NTZ26_08480 [Candidatus Aminicenantes bacterium]|nr:hypothetical protein [Candidatus Aminicenantes bacterium]
MHYKSIAAVAFIVIAAAFLWPSPGLAQEEGNPFSFSNFTIELTGGWSRIAPGNINRAVDGENLYLQHYYVKKYAYYDNLYGDAYTPEYRYTAGKTFLPLTAMTPVGAYLRYQVSPTFALSFGLQYLKGVQNSDVGLDVEVANPPTGVPFTAHYTNSGFVVSAKAWMPQLGVHFGWNLLKFLRTEIYLQGGPILADFQVLNQRRESVTTETGTTSASSRTMELTGHADSVAIELGGQIRIKLLPFLEIYGRGGYAFRKLTKIHGPHTIHTVVESPVPSETDYSLSGTWGISWENATTAWGKYAAPILTTNFSTIGHSTAPGTTVANGELSGFQLTAGLAIRL